MGLARNAGPCALSTGTVPLGSEAEPATYTTPRVGLCTVGSREGLRDPSGAALRAGRSVLVGFAIFGLLWLLYIPMRTIYVPRNDDINVLADGLLLAPGAHWQDWFTQGYSHFFDFYPDWPAHGREVADTNFARPTFQFIIYLAHFALGRDWASYQLINCLAVAAMGAVAFQIAQTALGLRAGPSLVAAMLVVLSPPVLESWKFGLAFASEPLATVFVAGAFLAVLARRDLLCLALLVLALLTKETAVWGPFAATITVMLRPKPDEPPRRRAFTAAAMLLPVAVWLALRFAFFGGIGGTHGTAGYTPLPDFLKLIFYKLTHVHYLLIARLPGTGLPMLMNQGATLLVYALLSLWAISILSGVVNHFRYALHETRWPAVDTVFLVTLWAAFALAFNFALPLVMARYATSVVVFAWPALVAEVEHRGKAIVWLGLAVCFAVPLILSPYYYLVQPIADPVQNDWRNKIKSMNGELRQVPPGIRQIYVLSAGSLLDANPEYIRLVLGVSAEIVRVVDIEWNCRDASDLVAFDHTAADGVVSMVISLPGCANFFFHTSRFDDGIINRRLNRNDTLSYELPQAYPIKPNPTLWWQSKFYLGRKMTLHFRPNGRARFIIEHGGPNGIAWFDAP